MLKIKHFLVKNFSILLVFSLLFIAPAFSFAGTSAFPVTDNSNSSALSSLSGRVHNPINAETIDQLIKEVLQGVIKIAIPIIALAIIYSGFLFVSARGNEEKLTKAKDALLYTCIGAAILLGAWALAQLISETILAL